jgi:hypothetical protein
VSLTLSVKTDNTHWYTKDGEPAHGADLRKARKENLLPGVTSVLQILSKPELEIWKTNNIIETALGATMLPGETDREFRSRIILTSKEISSKASTMGTAVHQWVEDLMAGKRSPVIDGLEKTLLILEDWINQQDLSSVIIEAPITNTALGYGGRVDLQCVLNGRPTIIDWKTTANKDGKLKPYPEYCWQLSAYGEGNPDFDYINVMISTNPEKPGINIHQWTPGEIAEGWTAFKSCLEIWKIQRNYYPVC